MKTKQSVFTHLLLFTSLLAIALGGVIRAGDHDVACNRSSSYATNGVGITSVVYDSPDGQARGQASRVSGYLPPGQSDSRRAAQMNISWVSVTETYVTTSVNVIVPVNFTQTYIERSTELTSTTLEMSSFTQTFVEIAGYSTIDTYTTTFLEPASSSTYSVIRTVTTTSSELFVPTVDTLTLTGTLPGALASGSLVKRLPEHSLTDEVMGTLSSLPVGIPELSQPIQSVDEHTESPSPTTSVLIFTVTNTYSVTPMSENGQQQQQTVSSDPSSWTLWFMPAPTTSNSTITHLPQPAPTSTLPYNTSALTHAATTMVPEMLSTSIIHVTSVVPNTETPPTTTGTASRTSDSVGSKSFSHPYVHISHIAMAASLWYFA